MKKVVSFGAGSVGRGFLGNLYSDSGWETVFVDVDQPVIDALSERGEYELHIASIPERVVSVKNVRGVYASDVETVASEIRDADLISTAVGAGALPAVCSTIARGLELRMQGGKAPINILVCENLANAADRFRSLLLQSIDPKSTSYVENEVGLVETVISRMVPVVTAEQRASDVLYISAEEYAIIPINRDGLVGEIPDIKGLIAVEGFEGHKQRKLFTHNCAHSLFAYYGYQHGHKYIWQAIEDGKIHERVAEAVDESGRALISMYGFDPEEQREHAADVIRRAANRSLGDTVARVGRDPIRKLGSTERFIAPARAALSCGIRPIGLARGIACALKYDEADDQSAARLQAMLRDYGIDHVLREVCGLSPDEALYGLISEACKD